MTSWPRPVLAALRRELAVLARDPRVATVMMLLALCTTVTAMVDAGRLARIQAGHEAADALSYRHWLEQGDKNPHSAAHFGLYVSRPVVTAAFIVPGVTEFTGNTLWIEAHKQNASRTRDAEQATRVARLPAFSSAFVLEWLAPLVTILVGYSVVAGDRERGVLRMLLGQGVRPGVVLIGKTLAVIVAIAVIFLPFAILAMVASPSADRDLPRLAGIALAYGLYLATFAIIAVAVSAFARTTGAALAVLVAFWVLACVVAPRIALAATQLIVTVPDAAAIKATIEAERRQTLERLFPERGMGEFEREVLAEHGVQHRDELPFRFRALALQQDEYEGNATFDRHLGSLWRAEQAQERATLWFAWLSPLVPVRLATMAFAGTDVWHDRAFATAAETYRRAAQRTLNEDLLYVPREQESQYTAGRELWARIPPFRYVPPDALTIWRRELPSLGLMLAWLLVATGLLRASERRLQLRQGR